MGKGTPTNKASPLLDGTRAHLQTSATFTPDVTIAFSPIIPVEQVKIVGVTFDSHLNFDKHVTQICQASNFHLRALGHIRGCLDIPTANLIASSIVGSRLDYCNSVLSGISEYNISRLQRVQNRAARIVLRVRGRVPTSPLLRQLHWLPFPNRIDYKIALITYKTLVCHEPGYLSALLTPYVASRCLRSDSAHLLVAPRTKTVFQSRAFHSYAPRLWNRLPQSLRDIAFLSTKNPKTNSEPFPNLSTFKSGLKAFLFDSPISFLAM